MILALDVSITSTGFCLFDGEELKGFGVIKTNNKKGIYERLGYIEEQINKTIHDYNVAEVVIEAPAYGGRGNMSYALFGVHFSIVKIVHNLGIPYKLLNIASVKKFATRNGRASKIDMLNSLPEDIHKMFLTSGFLKSKGLYDLTDAYFIGIKYIKER